MSDPLLHWTALAVDYQLRIDGYWIKTTTNNPCHLTQYWTDVVPQRHHATRTIRGALVPWGAYFCFVAWRKIEQTEAGDTLLHTFQNTPWPICQTRWLTFRGTVGADQSPSISAIFEKHYAGSFDLFRNPSFELWPYDYVPPVWWTWTSPDHPNVWASRQKTDITHGRYSLRLDTNGWVDFHRIYQEIDATPHRGHWIQIRPDMKGNPIYYTGVNIQINGTPAYSGMVYPVSPDYWNHVDFWRKVPDDATIIRCELRVDSFWHVPNWCLFDNIRSVVHPIP